MNDNNDKATLPDLDMMLKDELHPGLCRCCLENGLFRNMLGGTLPTSTEDYAKILRDCYDLSIIQNENPDSTLSYLICDICIGKLKESYIFKLQVINAQKSFDQTFKNFCRSREELDFNIDNISFKSEADDSHSDYEPSQDSLKSLRKRVKAKIPLSKAKRKKKRLINNLGKRKSDDVLEEKAFLLGMDKANLQCKICLEVFKSFHSLNRHINVHFPNHICETCGKGHATKLRLRRHRIVHATGHFTCEECGKAFETKSKFENHRAVHILPLRHMCSECPERFSTFLKRQRHLQLVHNRDIYNYKCDYCDKVFPTSGNLTNHRKRVHLKVKNHTCHHCGKSFFDGKAFREHSVVHSGERSHQCEVCLKSYGRQRTLKLHMRSHDAHFECGVCGHRYGQKTALKTHMKSHAKAVWYHQQ